MTIKLTQIIDLPIFLFFSIGITIISPLKSSADYSYQDTLEIQKLMFQGLQYCRYFEMRTNTNSNDYEARKQLNNCLFMIRKKGICETQKVIEYSAKYEYPATQSPIDFTDCYVELANYANYIGGNNR